MSHLNFVVDAGRCVQCDACVRDCPSAIIVRDGPAPAVPVEPEDGCLECQHCLAICPTGALSIFGLKPEDSLPLAGGLPTRKHMKTFVRGRRSVRRYKSENVDRALMDELLADLAHAPTGCNDRDLTFSIVDDRAVMAKLLERLATALEEGARAGRTIPEFLADAAAAYRRDGTDEFFRSGPHLLVVSHGEKATTGAEDVVLALAYFELLAQSAGLGTVWCGFLKFAVDAAPELREVLGVGPSAYFYPMVFGYPAVKYARTVQRDPYARIHRIAL
jgi:nitroreductase/NAD-dependent dihydropyrimidine dehydrogenase PreA subunit